MEAVRRQFRLSRDEDLQAVSVWRRAQPAPAELSKLQLTVRPENGARLRRLVQQLGSEEAAIDFLLQMDDNCGTWRWWPRWWPVLGGFFGRGLDALSTFGLFSGIHVDYMRYSHKFKNDHKDIAQ